MNAAREQIKSIQDLRVTRVQPGEKKEREVVRENVPLRKVDTLASEEKLAKALRKKLRAIEQLMEKQKAGEKLDDKQLAKIESVNQVIEEMEDLEQQKQVLLNSTGAKRSGGSDGSSQVEEEQKVEGGSKKKKRKTSDT